MHAMGHLSHADLASCEQQVRNVWHWRLHGGMYAPTCANPVNSSVSWIEEVVWNAAIKYLTFPAAPPIRVLLRGW